MIKEENIEEILEVNNENKCLINLRLKRTPTRCPRCGSNIIELKEWKQRTIKHALFFDRVTLFVLKIRRYKCKECGNTFAEDNPFAPRRARLSYETIHHVLEALRNYNETYEHAGKTYKITSTTVQNIFDKYVNPSRKILPRVLSVDECYNKGQFSHPYSCILFDFLKTKIVDIIQNRSKFSLGKYFSLIDRKERENVEYFVIDMWEPYLDVSKTYFPKAIVAVDSFHVMENLGRALDKVRCRVMKKYSPGTIEYYLLKQCNYVLYKQWPAYGKRYKSKRFQRWINEYEILQMMLKLDDDLKQAHLFYVRYQYFNERSTYDDAIKDFDYFISDMSIVMVPEFLPVISMLTIWKQYIINSFIRVDNKRLSNGPIEGFNSCFKKVIRVSNGLGNPNRFRNRLIFCYNKEKVMNNSSTPVKKNPQKRRGQYSTKKVTN